MNNCNLDVRRSDLCVIKGVLLNGRQLVKAGVLTVRDAGSWWFSIPNSGRFTKYFIQGKMI